MSRYLSLMTLILAICTSAGAQQQLRTASSSNNAANGIMFDVVAIRDVRLNGVELHLDAGPHVIEMYRVTGGGSFVGHENNPSDWTLVDTVVLISSGPNSSTLLASDFEVSIPAGATQGLYFTSVTASMRYNNGVNSGGVHIANGDLSILEGVGRIHAFGSIFGSTGPGNTSRIFRGALHYAIGLVGAEEFTSTQAVQNDSADSMTFDIEAHEHDVIITGISAELQSGSQNLQLWVAESNVPNQVAGQGFANWRMIASANNFSPGPGIVRLPMDFEAVVPAGTRRGFYLTTTLPSGIFGEVQPADGSKRARGDDFDILNGTSYVVNFGSTLGAHMFSGSLHYRVPQQDGGIAPGGTRQLSTNAANSSNGVGIFFDLASNEPIVITGFDHGVQTGNHTIEVWAVSDGTSYLGNTANSAAWTRISSEVINLGASANVTVASDLRLFIPAGGTQGIYITGISNSQNSSQFEGTLLGQPNIVQDGTLSISAGIVGLYPFIPQTSGAIPQITAAYERLGRAEKGFFENFNSASGIQAPTGWISSFVLGNRAKLDGWRFDNPGSRFTNLPIDSSFAICDSDDSGSSNPIDAALISPSFNASLGNVTLHYDYYFRQFGSSIGAVEVWDGLAWNVVETYVTTTSNPDKATLDITAACGGSTEAMIRFRYTGNFDWWWMLDNIHVQIGQTGQRPQLGIGEFDCNFATDALYGQPVSSGLPGPYVATANTLSPTIFSWDGEPNQPLRLFAGNLNIANVVLDPQGQLDVGSFDPMTNTFPGIFVFGDGTLPDFDNASYRTSNAGRLVKSFIMPPFTVGLTFNFQSVVFSSTQNIALTNVVSLTVVP